LSYFLSLLIPGSNPASFRWALEILIPEEDLLFRTDLLVYPLAFRNAHGYFVYWHGVYVPLPQRWRVELTPARDV
jgi:hypothetical protein